MSSDTSHTTESAKEQSMQSLRIFRGLEPKQLRMAAVLVDEATRPAGWVLMRQGEFATQAFNQLLSIPRIERTLIRALTRRLRAATGGPQRW